MVLDFFVCLSFINISDVCLNKTQDNNTCVGNILLITSYFPGPTSGLDFLKSSNLLFDEDCLNLLIIL